MGAASTTSKPSGGNGSATSKSFYVPGDAMCIQWTFDKSCTKAQLLASSLDTDKDELTMGECPVEFEKACNGKFKSTSNPGESWGSPMTFSADETNGCGEAERVWLTKNCDICSIKTGLYSVRGVVEKPTCRVRGSEGFFKDFINNVIDGEPLYLGIVAAAVLVPLVCCLMCCCCAANPSRRGKVTYVSRV